MPNPEEREHELATMAAVRASGAEVGVMLDTDVDRCGLIDGMRSPPEPVNKNRLIALCARVALESAGGKGVIVTDPVTSAGMASYIASCGGEHDRFKMGYRNVKPVDTAAALASGSTTRPPLPQPRARALPLLLGSGPISF